jgi:hypothetical protein
MEVCLPVRRNHTGVVHVCKHTFQTVRDAVHHLLESLCSVRQPKRHEQKLEQSKWCDNRCFWDVFGCNRDFLVITLDKIDFCKNVATMQAIGKVLHVWQRVPVRGCHQIETAIIAKVIRIHLFWAPCARERPMVILNSKQCRRITNQ